MSEVSDAISNFSTALMSRIGRVVEGPVYFKNTLFADRFTSGTSDIPLEDAFASLNVIPDGFSAPVLFDITTVLDGFSTN